MMRTLLLKTLRYSGLPFFFREVLQRKKVSIVMFHDITADYAERVFPYLAERYNIIDLNDFLEARRRGDRSALPEKALIITLDDGHIGNYALLPVLKKHRIPVTIFLCSGIINTNRHYWFKFKRPDISTRKLKTLPNQEKLERLAEAGFWPEREFNQPQALTKTQIREMAKVVNFQGHTVFHPCLPTCTDEEAQFEIFQSKETLEQDYQLNINAIAFPNGDYSDRDIELVKAAGYACAITVDHGFNTIESDPYRLKRLSIDDRDSIDTVALKACGLWGLLKSWIGGKPTYGYSEPMEQPSRIKDAVTYLTHLLAFPAWDFADSLLLF